MNIVQRIAEAMELYGESVVSDLIAKNGNFDDIVAFFNTQFELELLKIAKYETNDGITFREKKRGFSNSFGDT